MQQPVTIGILQTILIELLIALEAAKDPQKMQIFSNNFQIIMLKTGGKRKEKLNQPKNGLNS